jgi:ABC-2 type transport system permease protein
MWKALLKKQFIELVAFYFPKAKSGKKRSGGGLALVAILMVFVLLSLGASFYTAAEMLSSMLPMGLGWLYFALMGTLSVLIGVLGGVFSTYAGLYLAKDNDFLLSLPIPPRRILLVRMIAVYAAGLVYSGVAWIPASLRYFRFDASPAPVIFSLLLTFVNALLVLVLSCLLGWVVAAVSSRLRRKNVMTIILSLAFLAFYLFFTSRTNQLLTGITQHIDALGNTVKGKLWPLYQLGLGASGKALPMLCWCCLVLAAFLLTCTVLSRSFIRLVTANRGAKKAVYHAGHSKASTPDAALLRKELRRFLGSPVYLLNCGLGILFLLLAAGFLLVRAGAIRETMTLLRSEERRGGEECSSRWSPYH